MRTLAYILILMMALAWSSCSTEPSAIDQLKNRYDERINALRLPARPDPKGKEAPLSGPSQQLPTQEKPQTSMNLSSLQKKKNSVIERLVIVTGEKIPLYKGPGPKFKRMAYAYRDQKFKLLRTVKGSAPNISWHLIHDRNNQSFFISTYSSRVIEKKVGSDRKVVLKRRDSADAVNPQGMFDPAPLIPQELAQANHITLNFENTDIYEVITTFCELLKINYIIEGKVQGKITLQTFRKVPTKDLYSVFEQILAVNGITVVKSGNFYRFRPDLFTVVTQRLTQHIGNGDTIGNHHAEHRNQDPRGVL